MAGCEVSVEFRFGEEEDGADYGEAKEGGIEPPEITPANFFGHGSGDDGSDLKLGQCCVVNRIEIGLTISEPK